MKTRHCDECAHMGSLRLHLPATVCDKGYRPRFFLPTSAMDTGWGYKRQCADYEEAPGSSGKIPSTTKRF